MRTTAALRPEGPAVTGDAVGSGGSVVDFAVDELGNGSWAPSPSPDGGRVVFVSDRGGAPQVWLSDPAVLPTGADPVSAVHWSPDGNWIACEIAPGGAPRTELWLLRPDGTGWRQIAGFGATTVLSAGWVEVNGQPAFAVTEIGEVWRALLINPRTAGRSRLAAGELVALLDVSHDGRYAVLREGPRGRRQLTLADRSSGAVRPLPVGTGAGSTERARFSLDGSTVYARTDVDGELARLVALPVDGGPAVTVAARDDAELDEFVLTADGGTAGLLWNVAGRSELEFLDLATGSTRPVHPTPGEVLSGPAFSRDGRVLAVCAEAPGVPRALWRIDAATGAAAPLESGPPPSVPAVVPTLHRVPSTDGLLVTGWLYRPSGGPGPYPTMISLHPGPEAQERPGHHPIYQQLAAHGIAVFAPNVRGSSGFGRTFVNADNLAGRHGAIADVAACVSHLIEAGIAEPGRVGCMGRSYGGYLTMAALVGYPELFAVGVEVCGMADLLEFYAHTEPWIAAAAVSKYGHPERDRDLLAELSPLRRIDRLAAPLLVVHGENDTNVPVREAHQLVAALRARGLPHRFVCLPGEGHEFLRRENRRRYLDEAVTWILHHLRRQ